MIKEEQLVKLLDFLKRYSNIIESTKNTIDMIINQIEYSTYVIECSGSELKEQLRDEEISLKESYESLTEMKQEIIDLGYPEYVI